MIMPSKSRSLRPGDVIRIGHEFPRRRVDEDAIDYLRVHFDTTSPGLGHIVEVGDDGMTFSLWGHLFHTSVRAGNPNLRPLNRLRLLLAPERLGEALLRRDVAAAQVTMTERPTTWQPLVRWWLRRARAPLPALEALGGRIHPPPLRWSKARLYSWLGTLGAMQRLSGFLDHGLLLDRIGVTVTFDYSGRERQLWLDRIVLHKNHNIHLVGIDLDSQEQRTFRLDKIYGTVTIPPLGEVDRDDLYWQIEALCMSRAGWVWYWNRYQDRHGRPPAPPIGLVGKALSLLAKPAVFLWNLSWIVEQIIHWVQQTRQLVWLRYWHLRSRVRWHIQEFRAARRPVPRGPTLPGEQAWRRRLERAIATIEAGGAEQVTCLLPMRALLSDGLACRVFLRHLMELTLADAKSAAANSAADSHPEAPDMLAEVLAISPPTRQVIPVRELLAAKAMLLRLKKLQPGGKRVGIHATRRAGKDARLLLAESYLAAVYNVSENAAPFAPVGNNATPDAWDFYRTTCYFVARWDERRFRMDASSAARLLVILEWWGARPDA